MWCLLAGKLMALTSYSVILQTIENINELNYVNTIFGWFLVEHLFEEYFKTAGKFFLVNRDFRNLIKNILIVTRNIIGFAYFLTLVELLLSISLLITLTYCLYNLFITNKVKGIKNEMLIFAYYSFIMYVLLLKLTISFNWFDVCFLIKSFVIFYFFYISICFSLNLFKRFSKELKIKQKSVLPVKTFFYFLNMCFLFAILLYIIAFTSTQTNNVVQEIFVKILLFYSFIYF